MVKSGRGVTRTPHPHLVPWSWKGRAIPLLPLWAVRPVQSLSACTKVTFNLHLRLPLFWSLAAGLLVSIKIYFVFSVRSISVRLTVLFGSSYFCENAPSHVKILVIPTGYQMPSDRPIIKKLHNSDFIFLRKCLCILSYRIFLFFINYLYQQTLEAFLYKQKGRGFDSRWRHWNFALA